ncbi:MAG: hypothetical protein U0414_25930 [Polyangiaceae bacterium]
MKDPLMERAGGSSTELLDELRTMLSEAFALREKGVHRPLMMQVQRAVDRRMAMLIDTKLATQSEILKLVAEEREKAFGAATRTFVPESTRAERRRVIAASAQARRNAA